MSWATFWTAVGTDFFKKGLAGLAGDGGGNGSSQLNFPSFAQHKVGMEIPSKAGEAGEIETADVMDIAALQRQIFNPPYQKTEIVIPPIMRV